MNPRGRRAAKWGPRVAPATLTAGLFLAGVAGACAETKSVRPQEPTPEFHQLEPAHHNRHPELRELSGLTRLEGWFWAHNDSGDKPRIFRARNLDFSDAVIFSIDGARAVDWEEVTTLEGDLLICDIGDNRRQRDDLMLYRIAPTGVSPPAPLIPKARYPIRYPDGKHDGEAAFSIGSSLYLVSKDRGEGTNLYRFDPLVDEKLLGPGEANVGTFVTPLDVGEGEMVTAAALDGASGSVYLLTYGSLLRFAVEDFTAEPDPASIRTKVAPRRKVLTWMRQAEAMCLAGESLVIGNEERDVFVLDRAQLEAIGMAIPQRPALSLGRTKRAVPLRDALSGEALRWSVTGDRLLLEGRFRYDAPDTLETSPFLQVGIVLGFARTDRPRLAGDEVLVGLRPATTGIAVERLTAEGDEFTASAFPDARARGTAEGGWIELAVDLPLSDLRWSTQGDARPRLFDLHGYGLREGAEVHVAAPGIFALERPYTWANVRIAD